MNVRRTAARPARTSFAYFGLRAGTWPGTRRGHNLAAAAALFTLSQGGVAGPYWWLIALLYGVVITALIFVLLRCGLVATIAAVFFVNAVNGMALGTDWSAWNVPASLATLLPRGNLDLRLLALPRRPRTHRRRRRLGGRRRGLGSAA